MNAPDLYTDRVEGQAPNVPRLLEALSAYEVRYVLVGSVAASLYGADSTPGDLDIVPAPETDNLRRLASLLLELNARPSTSGHWVVQPDGEKRWVTDKSAMGLESRAHWTPDPHNVASFDHLFFTKLGNLDVVPELVGSFERLNKRAVPMNAHGREIRAAHPDDLLATLTVPRRKKDAARVRQLREVQRSRAER